MESRLAHERKPLPIHAKAGQTNHGINPYRNSSSDYGIFISLDNLLTTSRESNLGWFIPLYFDSRPNTHKI